MRTRGPFRAVHFMRTQFVSYENTIREPAREWRAQFTISLISPPPRAAILVVDGQGELERQSFGATVITRRTRPDFEAQVPKPTMRD
jgi:hypothetical protein